MEGEQHEDSSASDHSSSSDILHPINYENAALNFYYNDPKLYTGYLSAVIEKNLEKLKKLVCTEGANPRQIDNNGNTPLHVAVLNHVENEDSLEILEFLIGLDEVDINKTNFYGQTALLLSALSQKATLVRFLVEHGGADVTIPSTEDNTPLHYTVRFSVKCSELLLQSGADINHQDYNGDTPLHDCVIFGDIENLNLLLYYNADTSILNSGNLTAFTVCLATDKLNFANVLFEYVTDFNVVTEAGMSSLFLAITSGYSKIIEMIERGADVNYSTLNYNVFNLGVPLEIETFKYIWERIDYEKVWGDIRGNILIYYIKNEDVTPEYKIKLFEIVLNSEFDKLRTINLGETPLLYPVVEFFHSNNVKFEKIQETCLILLSNGNAQLYDIDLDLIYEYFGYSELFQLLLYIDFDEYRTLKFNIFPKFIYDKTVKRVDLLQEIRVDFVRNSQVCFDEIFEFMLVPSGTFQKFLSVCNQIFMSNYRRRIMVFLHSLNHKVPNLKELARDSFSAYLTSRIQRSSHFYIILKRLEIPLTVREILSFQRILYEHSSELASIKIEGKTVNKGVISRIYNDLINV